MAVWVSGDKKGLMRFSAQGLDRNARKSLEATLRQRGFKVIGGYSEIIVQVQTHNLHGRKIADKLLEIHTSIQETINHKVAQATSTI